MKKTILLINLLFVCFSSYSQKLEKDTIGLNDVVISASRFNNDVVNSSVLITDSCLNFSQETPSYFQTTPSVSSQSDNGTDFGYSYYSLRGIGQSRINYTINGIPLNDGEDLSVYTNNYTNIINNLNSIQIIRGSGISSNGASSYAGLVNMELKNPLQTDKGVEIGIMHGSYNSYSQYISYNSGIFNKNFGIYANISSTGTDGYRDFSQGQSQSGVLSLGYKDSLNSLKLNVIYGHNANEMSWLPVPETSDPKTNILVYGNLKASTDNFNQGIYQLQYSRQMSKDLYFSLSPYIVTINGNYDFPLDSNTLGNLELKSINKGLYSNLKLYKGYYRSELGLNYNDFSRKHSGEIYTWNYDNTGFKKDYSMYFKSCYEINRFSLNGDIQYRVADFYYESQDLNKGFFNYEFFNYFAGINYKIDNNSNLFISYANSNREPSRTDLFGYNDHIDNSNIDQVNIVKPEQVKDIEAGFRFNKKSFTFSSNFYYMDFENEIISTNQINYLGILLRKNVKESQRSGIEVETSVKIRNLTLGGNLNLSKNRMIINNQSKEPILTPQAISYVYSIIKIQKISLEVNYKYASKSYLESSNNERFITADYHFVNSVVSYNFQNESTLSFFANNLLNKNWESSGNVTYDEFSQPVSSNYFYSSKFNFFVQLKIKI